MNATIDSLTQYPIKGLSGHALETVDLSPKCGFPIDRVMGFAKPGSGFDPSNPMPLSKDKFHVLANDPRLALLDTTYDVSRNELTIDGPQGPQLFQLDADTGMADACTALQQYLDLPDTHKPTLFSASPHRFTDVSVTSAQLMNAVSLISQDSVDAFARTVGHSIDAARFRGNIVFSGMPAFQELDLLGRTVQIGEVHLHVLKRTKRCAATEVNLQTGERDVKVPYLLRKHFGHMDMGVYAEVVKGGAIRIGDEVTVL